MLEFTKNGEKCSCNLCRYSDKDSHEMPCCNCIDSIIYPDEHDETAPLYEESRIKRQYFDVANSNSRASHLAYKLFCFDDIKADLEEAIASIVHAVKYDFVDRQVIGIAARSLQDEITNFETKVGRVIEANKEMHS